VPGSETARNMTFFSLLRAYYVCRKGKCRSKDTIDFEVDRYGNLYKLYKAINRRRYTPLKVYSFVNWRSKPREIFAASFDFKIVMTYIDCKLKPLLYKVISKHAYNNIIGRGPLHMVQDFTYYVKDCVRKYGTAYLIKCDLKGFYPNIDQEITYNKVVKLLDNYHGEDKDELLYLCYLTCFNNPQFTAKKHGRLSNWEAIDYYKSLYSKPFGTGAPIGFLFWQSISNYYLNDIDRWVIKNMTPYYCRFVDDMYFITPDKSKVLQKFPELREQLAAIKVTMHPRKFYCQHYTKGIEILGHHWKPYRIHVNNKTVNKLYDLVQKQKKIDNVTFMRRFNTYAELLKYFSNQLDIIFAFSAITKPEILVDWERQCVVTKDLNNYRKLKRQIRELKKRKYHG